MKQDSIERHGDEFVHVPYSKHLYVSRGGRAWTSCRDHEMRSVVHSNNFDFIQVSFRLEESIQDRFLKNNLSMDLGRIVLYTFEGPPPNCDDHLDYLKEVDKKNKHPVYGAHFKDGDKLNPSLDNLEWMLMCRLKGEHKSDLLVEDRLDLIALYENSSMTQTQLAEKYGITQSAVSHNIRNMKRTKQEIQQAKQRLIRRGLLKGEQTNEDK